MDYRNFYYVIYIRSTPDQVWNGLIDPEITREYWEHYNISDWKPGSPWSHQASDGSCTVDIMGEVLDIERPGFLKLTWVFPEDQEDPDKYSTVTITIEAIDEMSRLTIRHENLEDGSEMLEGIVDGWPRVLSSLKSYLETGTPLPTWAQKEETAKAES